MRHDPRARRGQRRSERVLRGRRYRQYLFSLFSHYYNPLLLPSHRSQSISFSLPSLSLSFFLLALLLGQRFFSRSLSPSMSFTKLSKSLSWFVAQPIPPTYFSQPICHIKFLCEGGEALIGCQKAETEIVAGNSRQTGTTRARMVLTPWFLQVPLLVLAVSDLVTLCLACGMTWRPWQAMPKVIAGRSRA